MFSRINFVRMPHERRMKNGSSFAQKWLKIIAHAIGRLHALSFVENTKGLLSSSSPLCFGHLFVEAPPC